MTKVTRGAKVERQCEECLSDMQVRAADVKRGWGRFCSKACALKARAKKEAAAGVDVSAIDHHYPGPNPAEFVYHYHATYQTGGGVRADIDGIAQLSYEIKDMEGYRKLKGMIEPELEPRLTITSLSLLGRLSDTSAVKQQRDELLLALKQVRDKIDEIASSGDVGSWLDDTLELAEAGIKKAGLPTEPVSWDSEARRMASIVCAHMKKDRDND